MTEPHPLKVPERATEKELLVLIDLNRQLINHWKVWANATGPNAYETACREMKAIRRLLGADTEEPKDATKDQDA